MACFASSKNRAGSSPIPNCSAFRPEPERANARYPPLRTTCSGPSWRATRRAVGKLSLTRIFRRSRSAESSTRLWPRLFTELERLGLAARRRSIRSAARWRPWMRVLYELRQSLSPPAAGTPLAIGGTPRSDPYSLATGMVELVLRQKGWVAQSLGSHLPLDTLAAAIEHMRPRLFWLSVSYLDDEARFLREYADFHERVQTQVLVVVGGKALTRKASPPNAYACYCDNLQHLEGFASAAWPSAPHETNQEIRSQHHQMNDLTVFLVKAAGPPTV